MGRVTTFSLSLPNNLKVCDRYKPSCSRYRGVASLVPFCIILPAQDMEEVPFVKCQLLPVLICWFVVVECPDDLFWWDYCDRGFGSN